MAEDPKEKKIEEREKLPSGSAGQTELAGTAGTILPAFDVDLLVEKWWQENFPNSPVSRETGAWNHAFKAKENLKRRLKDV